ncbi:hypothetical protein IQ249_09200 [Lusitaniella coriacea LEGE 07157]|uniref:Uncharacterized protein n=1 Tax=Lusitaniella coriacea LEGE 07157 TaxID=945747 RepID=A0A8J7DVZ2_9CYAN|nr:hypothetical protein [Lusitaniella coriacea]MBE9116069.1 hypothetical protein [Lusitaniella coriacea LEGE 07157]
MSEQPGVQFLTAEESAKVDIALLSSPEKFLTRLTISSFRLLKIIAQAYEVPIEALTPQQIVDWFEKDSKIRREQGIEAAVLKW